MKRKGKKKLSFQIPNQELKSRILENLINQNSAVLIHLKPTTPAKDGFKSIKWRRVFILQDFHLIASSTGLFWSFFFSFICSIDLSLNLFFDNAWHPSFYYNPIFFLLWHNLSTVNPETLKKKPWHFKWYSLSFFAAEITQIIFMFYTKRSNT